MFNLNTPWKFQYFKCLLFVNKMVYCAAFYSSDDRRKTTGISYHCFIKDPPLREQWLPKICRAALVIFITLEVVFWPSHTWLLRGVLRKRTPNTKGPKGANQGELQYTIVFPKHTKYWVAKPNYFREDKQRSSQSNVRYNYNLSEKTSVNMKFRKRNFDTIITSQWFIQFVAAMIINFMVFDMKQGPTAYLPSLQHFGDKHSLKNNKVIFQVDFSSWSMQMIFHLWRMGCHSSGKKTTWHFVFQLTRSLNEF